MDRKYVFITGASSGIGKQIVLTLANNPEYYIYAGIRKRKDKLSLESLADNIKAIYIDVTNSFSVKQAYELILKNTEELFSIINSAGIAIAGPLEGLNISDIKKQFDVNTFGALRVIQNGLPFIKKGNIINISSMASYGIFPFISPYCASKSAIDIMINSLSIELNNPDINFVSVKLGACKTPIWNKSIEYNNLIMDSLDPSLALKYKRELEFLKVNALKNNNCSLDPVYVAKKIIKIMEKTNPRSSYNIGVDSKFMRIASKLPQDIVNNLVRSKLKYSLKKMVITDFKDNKQLNLEELYEDSNELDKINIDSN